MNAIFFPILTALATAGNPAAAENTLLKELVQKGVAMPDGQVVPLPPPMMAEGLTAAEQAVVLSKVALLGNKTREKFLSELSNAPVTLKILHSSSGTGEDVIRKVNLYFVVYGDWDVLTSEQFSKGILKGGKANNGKAQGTVAKAGYLKAPELAVRGLKTRSTRYMKEYVLYTTLNLFQPDERVELSTTRIGAATKTPTGVIVAAKLDSRFDKDKEFPNQWREITRTAAGKRMLGPPHPYSGAGFYAKVTRLIEPKNAIFVELHQVFYEPRAWFGEDDNLTPAELHKIIPFEVGQFRGKLARATKDAAEKKPGEDK